MLVKMPASRMRSVDGDVRKLLMTKALPQDRRRLLESMSDERLEATLAIIDCSLSATASSEPSGGWTTFEPEHPSGVRLGTSAPSEPCFRPALSLVSMNQS